MEGVYEFGPFRLETAERRLLRDGRAVRLRAKVFDTLCVLVSRSGSLVEKNDLLAAVWPDAVVEENNLAHNINALRKALGDGALIETVPGKGYRFTGEAHPTAGVPVPLSTETPSEAPVMIEREQQMGSLREAFAVALEGRRQFVCIPGEAGVGKTTLVNAFLQEVRRTCTARIGRGQCLENRGEVEPYIAVLEALGRLCRAADGAEVVTLLCRRAPTWLAQMPGLASAPALAELPQRNLGATRDRMLREFAEFIEELAVSRPVVLSLDDLHWSDDSTLSLLELLARRDDPARLMLIGTFRPAEATRARQPLEALAQGMKIRGQCRVVRPDLLSADAVRSMIDAALPGIVLDWTLVDTVHQRTGGNPLFVLALIDHWKATSAVVRKPDGWQLVADFDELGKGVPESLTAMIQQKIETLSARSNCCWRPPVSPGANSRPAFSPPDWVDGRRGGTAVRDTCPPGDFHSRRRRARMARRRRFATISLHSRPVSRGGVSTGAGGPALAPPPADRRGTGESIRRRGRRECESAGAALPLRRRPPALHPVLSAGRRAGAAAERPPGSGKPAAVRPRTGGAAGRNTGTPRGGVRISFDDGSRNDGCKGIRRAGGRPQFPARAGTRTSPCAS